MEPYTSQIFSIEYSEIRELFQRYFGDEITSIGYELSNKRVGMLGICGEYLITNMEISYSALPKANIQVFARRQLNSKESKQAHHYKYLGEYGIPTPILYGSKIDASGCEIMLLEYVHEIDDERAFFNDENNIKDFIYLAANLSSIKPSLEYLE